MRWLPVVLSMVLSKSLYSVTTGLQTQLKDAPVGTLLLWAAIATPVWIAAAVTKWLPFNASMAGGNGWWSTNIMWDTIGLATVIGTGMIVLHETPRLPQIGAFGLMIGAYWLAGQK